ncbi:MaoC family dehydratase [Pseudomaricurvus alkylphenolicus]|uniref:MaoC family dehydratase n=1 Tax=Pseudomaricurvus alkylphenolicus TaxID=1306991 RepID=UPI00141F0050|nr:MaoC family dehydratase [Pseudomaricurvus alkylphenolicus]NIB38199.1 MaoC family dehydratase [Pseudomaricurvus alkylphenolicus]
MVDDEKRTHLSYDAIKVGDSLPKLKFGPINRHTLALYCGGSGDHNPIHVDSDFAKNSGFEDVFAHGMLSMAVLGRLLTGWVEQDQIRTYGVRFTSITQVHDVVTGSGEVTEKYEEDGEKRIVLDVMTKTQYGRQTLSGTAVICLTA